MFLEVEKLTKSFGGLKAIRGIDICVSEGEIVGLIGPNGSGKTTLFNLITGSLKPDSGTIRLRGVDITGLRCHQVCHAGIARIFQLVKPFTQMTAIQNVMVGRVYGRNPARNLEQARAESKDILDFIGLGNKGNMMAGSLTLAERKKLELGRALASRPQLLLLDELMAGLNPAETETAMQLVQNIRDSGITMIMVEHIVKAVLGISNRVVVVSAGEKIAEGTPQQVVTNQQVIDAYLGKM